MAVPLSTMGWVPSHPRINHYVATGCSGRASRKRTRRTVDPVVTRPVAQWPAMTTPRPLRDLTELTDVVHELTSVRHHRQSYRAGWRNPNRTGAIIKDHVTRQESLLDQLRAAIVYRPGSGGGRPGHIDITVLPRFSADAFDRLEAIRASVADWCATWDIPSEGERRAKIINRYLTVIEDLVKTSRILTYPALSSIDVLRQAAANIRTSIEVDMLEVVRIAPGKGVGAIDALARDADRWRTWCRIVAGWDTPALCPHVPCPHCGALAGDRGGLRVRIEASSGTGGIVADVAVRAAVCLTCNTTWDADSIPALARQLRQAGDLTQDLLDGVA